MLILRFQYNTHAHAVFRMVFSFFCTILEHYACACMQILNETTTSKWDPSQHMMQAPASLYNNKPNMIMLLDLIS